LVRRETGRAQLQLRKTLTTGSAKEKVEYERSFNRVQSISTSITSSHWPRKRKRDYGGFQKRNFNKRAQNSARTSENRKQRIISRQKFRPQPGSKREGICSEKPKEHTQEPYFCSKIFARKREGSFVGRRNVGLW